MEIEYSISVIGGKKRLHIHNIQTGSPVVAIVKFAPKEKKSKLKTHHFSMSKKELVEKALKGHEALKNKDFEAVLLRMFRQTEWDAVADGTYGKIEIPTNADLSSFTMGLPKQKWI